VGCLQHSSANVSKLVNVEFCRELTCCRVSTGNGQPSITLYDSTLDFKTDSEEDMRIIPPTIFVRLRQEMAASRINKLLYSTNSHRFADGAATSYMNLEADRLKEERVKQESGSLDGVDSGMSKDATRSNCQLIDLCIDLEELYHYAVSLHLHLYSFFNPEKRLERERDDLVVLYFAATAYLERVFRLQRENRLRYVPYYVMQMALAAGFTLLKLLNSDFASKLPAEKGRQFVLQTVDALRKAKVWSNDLLDRFAEVLAQLWKETSRGRSSLHSMSQSPSLSHSGMGSMFHQHNQQQQLRQQQQDHDQRRDSLGDKDDPLGLTIMTRMSMSVVFDCAWKWREQQVNGAAEQLENTVMTNPTNPDSSTNSTPPPGAAVENPAHTLPTFNPHINTLSMPLQITNGMASANSFEMFDSVSWLLDTQPDWTYGSGNFGNDFGV
jgi:transcriptional regulatory protein LEU3